MILRHCWKIFTASRFPIADLSKKGLVLNQHRSLSDVQNNFNGSCSTLPEKFIFPTLVPKNLVILPATKLSQIKSIQDRFPELDLTLPCYEQIGSVKEETSCPPAINNDTVQCKHGILKIRRKKMNKHKLKKRRKRDRAQIRKVLLGRARNRRKIRARKKERLVQKIEEIEQRHPGSDYAERPYVIHRLEKW